MTTTRMVRRFRAPRAAVYHALVDADAIATWRVPDGMTSHIHAFDAREGGAFRISLTYESPASKGKTTAHTDTFHGRFVTLVPNERVVELIEFESDDPAMQGTMTISYTLADAGGGTELTAIHEGVPAGVNPADNELGWKLSLNKLAAYVEHLEP